MSRVGGRCTAATVPTRNIRKSIGTRIAADNALSRGFRGGFDVSDPQPQIFVHTNVKEPRRQMTDPPRLRRVLLVDDYPDAREMYSEYLKFSGFDVIEAGNGVEALQRAIETSPDIILMDLSLPVMDGWEATRRLKEDPRTAGIPVVALTGHALAGMFEGAKRAGCDAFVTKPCLPEDLVKEIHNVLDGGGAATD